MGTMKVRNIDIEPDFYAELEPYLDKFGKNRIRDNKLQACSPFRYEKTPSFAVNLDNGSWIDSGAVDEANKKGHFTQLLAYLREETWFDTEDYLLTKYAVIITDTDSLKLEINLEQEQSYRTFTKEEIKPYMWRVPYLTNRGITERVQRAFGIGYCKDTKAVMIPWCDWRGNIVNMKFRSVSQKRFWYHPEGQRIKQHVFGLHLIWKHNCKRAFAVESETDAMYLWSIGVPAIAFGGANMSDRQEYLILRSPLEEIVLATDNDGAGQRFKKQLKNQLGFTLTLLELNFPQKYKDINSIPVEELVGLVQYGVELCTYPIAFWH